MVKITLIINNNKVQSKLEGSLDYPTLLQVLGTFSLQTMNQLLQNAPPNHQEVIKGDIYDKFNLMASNVLSLFAPEYELNPDISTQALQKYEDDLIEQKYEEFLKDPANSEHLTRFKKKYKDTLKYLSNPNPKPKILNETTGEWENDPNNT